jgi:hypothetical protein
VTVCRRCATDADDGFVDPQAVAQGVSYRVTAFNLDGRHSVPSLPVKAGG